MNTVKNCDCDKNEIAIHCWEADHNFNWDQKKVIDRESRLIPRKIKETIHSLKNHNHINKISYMLPEIWLPNLRQYAQQDVVEVLEIILEELTGPCIITSADYNIKSLTSTICHTCHQLNRTEDILPILRLPILKDFPYSLAKVLETESLIGSNAPYCNICSGVRESDSKVSLMSVGNCLIVQLNHFFVSNDTVTKNSEPFFVSSPIEVVTEIEDEVFCTRKFNLAAVINHSGNLNSGHYTCLVKDGETWWHCNDKAVVRVNLDYINKSLPYVLFYQAK